ncbi:arylsulfatase [Rhodococcus sp. JVH1]|uniref:arylsulfatase n=1 Tax=Rhodococcus sp. JVH1 TaxID=745408 RepID=UPI000271DBE2|nr:arylsulfatase [Rhodococcus sp. JVH1]EJI95695.1 sulfatase family protein [Rhodococcus sp. JVH1]
MDRYNLPPSRRPRHPISPATDIRQQVPGYEPEEPVRPPVGAPNILLILVDDMGFGASSAFGGPCRMPAAERLAADGLRYTRFHTTALCSPTRAALLTGRNHHTCGMGGVVDTATTAPGYTGRRPREVATVARMLQANGYATGAFGKMHQTPGAESTPAGPFDRWPTQEGFDRFYGFLGAETNQFTPNLIDGLTPIEPPATEEEGYHLSEDLVDQSISWIDSVSTLDPDKPWFCYLSYGACHSPFQLPRSWRGRYRGEFAHGWDQQCEQTLRRQRELGIVPEDADLAPWAEGVPHWDELNDIEKEVAERLMESYASFAEHMDTQTGRLTTAIEQRGQLDDTLIIYILGDNGASAEGGLVGTLNEALTTNGFQDSAERIHERLDDIGGPMAYAHYPVGWALAMDTPYAWAKQVASHYGGTRNGMIVHWPNGIAARGELRHQWHHCIDVAPTLLAVAGIEEPHVVDGAAQRPIEGTPFAYTFADATAPDRHTTQYFEMVGNRGIYHDGWTAVTQHRVPWRLDQARPAPFAEDVWELYDTTTDWTQAHNVAHIFPEKLAELQERFLVEAARYQVFPLDDRMTEKINPKVAGRRDLMGDRLSVTLRPGLPGLREDAAPNMKNRSFTLTASLAVPSEDPVSGVIIAQGGRFGGWSLYLIDGKVCFCHNVCGLQRYTVRHTVPLSPGEHEVTLRFDYDGGGLGRGGIATISIDGVEVQSGRIDSTTPFFFSIDETMDVGRDRGTPVTEDYPQGTANKFGGQLNWVRVDLGVEQDEPSPAETLRAILTTH